MAHPHIGAVPAARTNDPLTSWLAAEKIGRTKTEQLRLDVKFILGHFGPMTDDELYRKYLVLSSENPTRFPKASPQSVRSRRAELEEVEDSGVKRPSNFGNPSTVWQVAA